MAAASPGTGDPGKGEGSGDPGKGSEGKATKGNGAGEGGVEDLPKLQDELARTRKALADANEEAKQNRLRLKKYEGIDPDRVASLEEADRRREEEAAQAAGDFEKLRDQLVTDRDSWKSKYEHEIADRKQERIANALLAAASDPEVDAVSGAQVVALYGIQFDINEAGEIVPKSALAINDDGKPMTPKEFLLKEREGAGANLFKSTLQSGSGHGGGRSDSDDVVRISRSDKANKVRMYEEAQKEGKKIIWTE
jgi:hypothetical protein